MQFAILATVITVATVQVAQPAGHGLKTSTPRADQMQSANRAVRHLPQRVTTF
jgi:hypothetical protein